MIMLTLTQLARTQIVAAWINMELKIMAKMKSLITRNSTAKTQNIYPHEQDFYERLLKNFNSVERIPKMKTEASSDFLINGTEWELKSILLNKPNKLTIRNEIYRATDKGKRNIFIDIYNDKINTDEVVEKAKKHISIKKNNEKIDNLVVVNGDKFTKIK